MQTKIERLPQSKVKLEIEVDAKQMADFLKQAFEKQAAKVEIKGFRPGKAPKGLILEKIGHAHLIHEALELAFPQTYYLALKENKIIPINEPAVVIKKNLEFDGVEFATASKIVYQVEIEVLPSVKLPDLSKIELKREKKPISVSQEELETVLKHLQNQGASHNKVERGAKSGDKVEIEFEGFIEGKKIESLCSKNYPLILGSGFILPDFDKELEGLKIGETKKFEISVPKPGQAAKDPKEFQKTKFEVKMLEVSDVILPELNEEFAKNFGAKNMDDLKEKIKADLEHQKVEAGETEIKNKLLETLAQKTEIDIPKGLIDKEIERLKENLQKNLQQQNIDLTTYLKKFNKSEADLEKDMTIQAQTNAKIGLILGQVAQEQSFDIKDEKTPHHVIDYLMKQVKIG